MPIFARIADVVVKHPRAIVLFWVTILAVALVGNQIWRVEDLVTYSIQEFIPKDTESATAERILTEQFPSGTATSSITVVIVAPNATSDDVRDFAVDLDEMIFASQYVGNPYPLIPFNLTNGERVFLVNPVRYLLDTTKATVYGIYRAMAFSLAANLTKPLHDNVTTVQGMLGMYYGIPLYYVKAWNGSGGTPASNATAYAATMTYITGSVPPSEQPLAIGYFQGFAGQWNSSFQPNNASKTPLERGDGVILAALPTFVLNSPLPPEAKAMQLNFTNWFNLTNFATMPLVENYTFAAFSSFAPGASAAFLAELYSSLPADATFDDFLQFARGFVRVHSLVKLGALIQLAFDPSRYYFSSDNRIMLMNYGFGRDSDYREPGGSYPIEENVKSLRNLVHQLKDATGATFEVYVTGSAAFSVDQGEIFSGGEELIVTAVLVVILIGLYFRSIVSPFFPLGTVTVAILVSNLFIYVIATHFFAIAFTTTAVLSTVLLAAGTDYSIFLISRYRDERLDGKSREEAVRQSVTWAGESIATSGGAVLLSFAALGLASFPIVKTMGISIGFAVTIAILLSITLVPSILVLVGNRAFWPYSRVMKRARKMKSLTRGYFIASAKFSMKHAKAIVAASVLMSIPATYLVVTTTPGYDFSQGIPPTESSSGLDAMSDAFGGSFFFQSFIVVQFPDEIILQDGNLSIAKMYALENLTVGISGNEGIKSIRGPVNPEGDFLPYRNWSMMTPEQRQQIVAVVRQYVGGDNRTAKIDVVFTASVFSGEAIDTVDQMNDDIKRVKEEDQVLRSSVILIGGATATMRDVAISTDEDLKVMAVVVAVGLFIILMIVLGSILIPLRAILTILLSITWTLAATLLLFKFWRGLDMIFVLPLIVFVLAMGLGMDYDIFIITRVREEVSKGNSDRDAILVAMSRTGGIVSACGLIMAGAFATLMISPLPFLQQMGFALAFVVLLDSMVVRIYLVPAIMVLAGKYNWWAPGRLQRAKRS